MPRIRFALTAGLLVVPALWAAQPPARAGAPAGVDLAGMDRSVKPGDDFDAFANGGWKRTAKIPDDRSSTGIFLQVFEKAERRNAEIIRQAGEGHPAKGSDA